MEDDNWLILEEYAKTLKVSPQAVRKAIEIGRIPATAVKTVESKTRGGQGKNVLIKVHNANVAWVKTENPQQGNRSPEARKRVEELREELGLSETLEAPKTTTEKQLMTLAEAQRRERSAKATIVQLELLKMQGILVQKDIVYKQLFEAGQQLRDAIMAVPDRITSEIIAANGNQTEIRKILTEALAGSLESLTDIYAKQLG